MRIGINGFGRIGRLVFRALWGRPGIELVHINDPAGDAATAAHLLEFDSVHGRWDRGIKAEPDGFSVEGQTLTWSQQKEITAVPWQERGVEMVLEASGKIKTPETLNPYFETLGLKRVVVACPVKGVIAGAEALNVVYGINHHLYEPDRHRLITAASCTTNCLAPIVKVLDQTFGLDWGLMTTIHSYTGDQRILDNSHRDLRRARAAALNMVPTTTGAAKAVALVYPEVKGKLSGIALRVPTPNVSVVDMVLEMSRETTKEEVNAVLKAASENGMKGIIKYTDLPLVSSDHAGTDESTIVDSDLTLVMGGNMVKVICWYDNEWGYSQRVVDLAEIVAKNWK
jgi:glyceraldehyde 3-phosphate dehydrogenase